MTWALNAYSLAFGGLLLLGGGWDMGVLHVHRRAWPLPLWVSLLAGIAGNSAAVRPGSQGVGGAIAFSPPPRLSLITTQFEEGLEGRRSAVCAVLRRAGGAAARRSVGC